MVWFYSGSFQLRPMSGKQYHQIIHHQQERKNCQTMRYLSEFLRLWVLSVGQLTTGSRWFSLYSKKMQKSWLRLMEHIWNTAAIKGHILNWLKVPTTKFVLLSHTSKASLKYLTLTYFIVANCRCYYPYKFTKLFTTLQVVPNTDPSHNFVADVCKMGV